MQPSSDMFSAIKRTRKVPLEFIVRTSRYQGVSAFALSPPRSLWRGASTGNSFTGDFRRNLRCCTCHTEGLAEGVCHVKWRRGWMLLRGERVGGRWEGRCRVLHTRGPAGAALGM